MGFRAVPPRRSRQPLLLLLRAFLGKQQAWLGQAAGCLLGPAALAGAAALGHNLVQLAAIHDDWKEVDLTLGFGLRLLQQSIQRRDQQAHATRC